jgi:hypothetical protein
MDICAEEVPEFVEVGPDHWVSCFQVNANPPLIQ